MEFEIKDIDRILETIDKLHDTFFGIHNELIYLNQKFDKIFDCHKFSSERIAKSLETIAQEMVVENETL